MAVQLRFHRNFKKSIKKLDNTSVGAVQKALFQFEENPDSPGLNLEKLHKNRFHSIRASRDLRIILSRLNASDKDIWLVLHADHHDDAYLWAKDRRLEFGRETQTFDLLFVEGKEIPLTHFSTQLPDSRINQLSNKELLELGVQPDMILKVKSIRNQVDVNLLRNYLPEITADALELLILGEAFKEVKELVKAGQVDLNENEIEGILDSPNNLQNIASIQRIDDLERYFSGDFEEWMVYLHPTQRILADRMFKGSVRVTGGAGTGKTVVALHRCKLLGEKRRDARKVLFTTFNEKLAKNLGGHFSFLGIERRKIDLLPIRQLVVKLAHQYGLISAGQEIIGFHKGASDSGLWHEVAKTTGFEYSKEFLKDEYEEVLLYHDIRSEEAYLKVARHNRERLKPGERPRVFGLLQKYKEKVAARGLVHPDELMNQLAAYFEAGKSPRPYSHIIVDEVQDFGMPELRLIRSMTEEGENDLFLVGDPAQKVYNKKFSFKRAGINIRGRRSHTLKINYRTTEEIRRAAVRVIKGEEFDDFEEDNLKMEGYYSLFQGEIPVYRIFESEKRELEFVVEELERLKKRGYPCKEICLGAFRNAEIRQLKKALHKADIPYFDLEEGLGEEGGVRISSFPGVKGMEFRVMILTGLCQDKLPYVFQGFNFLGPQKRKEAIRSQKAALYVAMSRARDLLIMTGTGEASEWLEPAQLPSASHHSHQ